MQGLPGLFIMIDGLDGVGKGVVQKAFIDLIPGRTFDIHAFWDKHKLHPDFENKFFGEKPNPVFVDLSGFDVLLSSEPTWAGVGLAIREEVIGKNNRIYSAKSTADFYACDRLVLYKRVIIPALKAGKTVIQSRGISTSIVYQPIQSTMQGELPLAVEDIISLEGNALALKFAPDFLIIPTIKDVASVMERLNSRDKTDNCVFENLDFQSRIKPLYESETLKNIFEKNGTKVIYLDAGISVEKTKEQVKHIYEKSIQSFK